MNRKEIKFYIYNFLCVHIVGTWLYILHRKGLVDTSASMQEDENKIVRLLSVLNCRPWQVLDNATNKLSIWKVVLIPVGEFRRQDTNI